MVVSIEKAIVARLETHGTKFEVLVDPDGALAIKEEKPIDLREILAIDQVFKDARKGDRVSEELMEQIFGTTDPYKVAEQIIKKGEIQLTSEQRKRMLDEKKKRIIAEISKHAVNPQTGAPHPPHRIEKAIEEAGAHVDPFKKVEEQIPIIIKALRPILPIKLEKATIAVKIPPTYTGKVYGAIKGFGEIKREEWHKDGSWIALVEIPAGMQDEFYTILNNLTKGEVQTKLVKRA
ncbi:MAG: ribosome assembly factor SBDS [Euryarchaeota archaeon]|nr:ribosome assembly factor SBDS [Euryarchaeota archaeon]